MKKRIIAVIVILAFFANNLGKLFMVLRVKNNFKFVSSNAPAYAAKQFTVKVSAPTIKKKLISDCSTVAIDATATAVSELPLNLVKGVKPLNMVTRFNTTVAPISKVLSTA